MTVVMLWAMAIGMADVLSGPHREWEDGRRRGPLAGTAALVVVPVVGVLFGGLSLPEIVIAAVLVVGSGGAWLWLRYAGRDLAALAVLGGSFAAALAFTGSAFALGGDLAVFFSQTWFSRLGPTPDAAALAVGVGVFLVGSGNSVVRIVLGYVEGGALTRAAYLRGGRIIGPIERLLIFGLGISGNLTAAGLVVAAKSLLRFGDVRSRDGSGNRDDLSRRAELMSEYLVVGSLVSWALALAAVAVVAA